jgi:hypothetical protein
MERNTLSEEYWCLPAPNLEKFKQYLHINQKGRHLYLMEETSFGNSNNFVLFAI